MSDRTRAAVLRGIIGFVLGVALATYLTHNIGPSPEVWGGLLP
jgi:hypothetical protein